MASILVHPNAKVNLGLNIKGRRSDGYHEIETIFLPAPLSDELKLTEAQDLSFPQLSIEGIPLDGSTDNNLCVRAWKLLKAECPELPAVRMFLKKNIPAGAGLGGGSSDAAFTLKALCEMFELKVNSDTLFQMALSLGADVPFFLSNQPMLATGIGEILSPLDFELPGRIVLSLPPVFSDTKLAYQNLNYAECHTDINLKECVSRPVEVWNECIFNDFEPSVFRRFPELVQAKEELYNSGAVYASMSGSGSALFGIFPAVS